MPARCIVDAVVHPMTAPGAAADAICWDDGGRILAVGDRDAVEAVAKRRGIPPESLPGRTITPGFVDAHMHFLHVGVRRMRPDLRGCRSLAEALDRVAIWMRDHPGDDAVIAEGWDESGWPERRFPTKDEVDGVSKDRALVLRRQDGHFAVANSPALALIRSHWDDADLVDLQTGIIKEAPSLYLNEVMPVPPDALDEALQTATDIAHRLGVTCVGEYTQAPFRDALVRAAEQGTLRIRIANHIYTQQLHDAIAAGFRTGTPRGLLYDGGDAPGPMVQRTGGGDATGGDDGADDTGTTGVERLRDGGLKVFLDGSFGGRTALLREPYKDNPDNPDNRGTPIWTPEECLDWFRTAHAAGIQITAHAIGDAAIDQGLDAYEATLAGEDAVDVAGVAGPGAAPDTTDATAVVTGTTGATASTEATDDTVAAEVTDDTWVVGPGTAGHAAPTPPPIQAGPGHCLRHRFEHYELPQDDALQRTVALGITACAQPNFLGEWSAKGGMYERRLGPVFRLNNRYRTFLDAGMSLCFGSDGMPFGPLYGIQAAVDHPFEEERLTAAEAVWLYTARAAWACHWDDQVGTLEVGKRADLLVLGVEDLEGAPATEWVVEQTVLDGTTVCRNDTPTPHAESLA